MKLLLETRFDEKQTVWTEDFPDPACYNIEEILIKVMDGNISIHYICQGISFHESQLHLTVDEARYTLLHKHKVEHIPEKELTKEMGDILPAELKNKFKMFKYTTLFDFLKFKTNYLLRFNGIGSKTILKINEWLQDCYTVRLQ